MRAWMLLPLLATFSLQQALPQAEGDAKSLSLYEEVLEPDSEQQEEDTNYLEPEPEQEASSESQEMDPEEERDTSQEPGEDKLSRSSAHHRGANKEFGDYTPFLLCLQRKQARHRETQQKASPKDLPNFKTQASSWVEHMKSFEAEVARTRCQPREVCVQVSTEHPVSTNIFYVPKCISVHRCGGCCNGEQRSCISTTHNSISKTLIELTIPPSREPRPVSILFVNHTGCECSSSLDTPRSINKRAYNLLHPINARIIRPSDWSTVHIRRTNPVRCSKVQVSCSSGLSWDPIGCRCVEEQEKQELRGNAKGAGVCGPHRVFSEDSCSCVCKTDHDRSRCGPHRVFSEDSCRCVCKNSQDGLSCGPHRVLSEDTCRCVCKNGLNNSSCGQHKVFIEDSCRCACKNVINNQSCGPHRLLEDSTCTCVCPEPALRNSCISDWDWDNETCHCLCRKSCPKHTSLNEATCQCQCHDHDANCTRRGLKFNPRSFATGYPAQGEGHAVRATITIVTLFAIVYRTT